MKEPPGQGFASQSLKVQQGHLQKLALLPHDKEAWKSKYPSSMIRNVESCQQKTYQWNR